MLKAERLTKPGQADEFASMTKPLVSVVMTVFKRTEYLEEAILSVLNQTFKDFELIVTDDANTEMAHTICRCFASDARVRYRSNPEILGAPLNIAAVIKEVQGEFVTIINDDDFMEPNMLEKLLPPLQNDVQCVISFGDHWIMDSSGKLLLEASEKNSQICGRSNLSKGVVKNPFGVALRSTVPFVMGTMFRKSVYQEKWLSADVAGAYDYWLALMFSLAGGHLYFVPERIMRWRTHANSESAREDPEKARCAVYIFQTLLAEKVPTVDRAFIQNNLSLALFALGRDQLHFNHLASARHSFWLSYKNRPNFKSLAGLLLSCLPNGFGSHVLRQWRRK